MEQSINNWSQIKKDAQTQWSKLTDTQLNMVNGNSSQLVDLICEQYGYTRNEANKQVDDFLMRIQRQKAA